MSEKQAEAKPRELEFVRELEDTLRNALAAASVRHHEYATIEHLLLALIDDRHARPVMEACGVNTTELRDAVLHYLDNELDPLKVAGDVDPSPTSGFQRIVQRAILHCQSAGRKQVNGAYVLVSLFSERESFAVYFLQQQDFSRLDAVTYILQGIGKERHAAPGATALSSPAVNAKRTRRPKVFVSYAWGDNASEGGRSRETIVEDLCASANKQGLDVRRDKSSLMAGDSILTFMKRIGRGDRIFVILSKKYLESEYCMYELSEIWRNSKQDKRVFLNKVRIFALEDANIYKPKDWVHWAVHWKNEYDELDGLARQHGASSLGTIGHRRLVQMQQFYMHVPDILGTIADVVIPRTLADLERYGFGDLVAPKV
jgi:hypothetical protein